MDSLIEDSHKHARTHTTSALMNLLIFVFFQGKGKMRTFWLLGEKTDVYVI